MPEKCICVECGKEFLVKPYMKDKAKFCSCECMRKHKTGRRKAEWITKICPSCGKEFETLSPNKRNIVLNNVFMIEMNYI